MLSVVVILCVLMLSFVPRSLSFGNRALKSQSVRCLRLPSVSSFRPSLTARAVSTSTYTSSEKLDITISAADSASFKGDVLVVPFYSEKPAGDAKDGYKELLRGKIPPNLPADVKSVLEEAIDEGIFKGDSSQKQVMRIGAGAAIRYVALVGLGPAPKNKNVDDEKADLEVSSASKLGRAVAALAKEVKAVKVGVAMPKGVGNAGVTQFILGIHDGTYLDNRFKKEPEGGHTPISSIKDLALLDCPNKVAMDLDITHKLTEMIASGVNFAKDLVGAPPNSKTPVVIADLARDMAKTHNLECKVLGEKECKELGMGGYLGVQQGSKFPPQFVHLTYKPDKPTGNEVKVALVGKGLTFDSGGYNLKAGPGSMIELMKFDMGGCAAVLGCAKAIGQLRPKNVEVHFITAICENMISSEAMRPGDILVASNGKTIEVLNTDAEGRLTLADALVYAERQGVDTIIDLATLTGACIVALGEKIAGLYSPDDKLRSDIENAAKRTEEGIWNLPLESSYKELIKSPIADLKNIGGKGGGSITAALFLQEFVEKAKWAHIDMAGPVWDTTSNKPTGYGVKLLIDFLLNAKK